MKRKVSLKDIAQKVGVSTALVSYVLNNKHENRISKEVAEKIRQAAAELNYRANLVARSLKTNRTMTIGLIVADIANPFFSNLARTIEDAAEELNYTVIFGSSYESSEKCRKLMDVFVNRQVDGLIVAPAAGSEKDIEELEKQHVPFVLIDRYFPGLKTNRVTIDNYKAAFTAVQHLQQQGFKKIAMVTYHTALVNLRERERGYREALLQYGSTVVAPMVIKVGIENNIAEIKKAIDALLREEEPADAVLFASNILSTEGLKYINSLAVKVPGDLAVVSFDESDVADLFYAPLTYIKQPLETIGRTAVKLVLDAIEGKEPGISVILDAGLVTGPSSAR
jgi:LacI family transcriptional regulator